MDIQIKLVLMGGLISLISTLAIIFIQHELAMRKTTAELKQHPFKVVYDKQTEFIDKLSPIIDELNSYITTIDVWLGEKSLEAPERVKQALENSRCVTEFYELTNKYQIYLPESLLREANELHTELMILKNNANMGKTYKSINMLFSFQNTIREHLGIDKLSEEFRNALSMRKR